MDSTAKILEQMDGGQFEKVCGPILQKMIPELKNLIPSGINVDGRVIKSLADGFCFVDKTHFQRFILLQTPATFTKSGYITAKRDLPQKVT